MKILVQGTKGGAKIFYPQTTPDEFYTFAGDVRDINGAGGVGKRAYSIALTADGCIFSKYLGVRDVQRSWDGNISFSLFLSNRQSMPGEKIQALLDELLSTYADRYIVDDNLDIVHEDWSFIEEITSFTPSMAIIYCKITYNIINYISIHIFNLFIKFIICNYFSFILIIGFIYSMIRIYSISGYPPDRILT